MVITLRKNSLVTITMGIRIITCNIHQKWINSHHHQLIITILTIRSILIIIITIITNIKNKNKINKNNKNNNKYKNKNNLMIKI